MLSETVDAIVSDRIPPGIARYPGNKRTRPLLLRDTGGEGLRIASVPSSWLPAGQPAHVATPRERATLTGLYPVLLLTQRLAGDDFFVSCLESESPEETASHYQRRGSYGHAVIRWIALEVTATVGRRILEVDGSPEWLCHTIRLHLTTLALRGGGERVRVRRSDWRQLATETLLSMGRGECLAPDCREAAEGRYCWGHAEHDRAPDSMPQGNPELARQTHDAVVASVSDLLGEVGELLRVPR